LNLRASVVEKILLCGHERLCGGVEPPFSSIAVLAQPLAKSVLESCLFFANGNARNRNSYIEQRDHHQNQRR
jgi:hypothetical protein